MDLDDSGDLIANMTRRMVAIYRSLPHLMDRMPTNGRLLEIQLI